MKLTEKYVPNLILSILMIFALIGSGATVFVKNYLADSSAYIENAEKNNITQTVMEEIDKYFEYNSDYSKIPKEVYTSAISEDDIKTLISMKINSVFTYIYAEGEYDESRSTDDIKDDYLRVDFDFTALEKSITDYFNKFAEENNVDVNDEYKNQLNNTIQTAKDEINEYTDIYMLGLIDKAGVISKARSIYKYADTAMYACIGLALLCLILIVIISVKSFRNVFYWMSTSLMVSSVLVLIPLLYLKITGFADRLIIGNKYIYETITGFISGGLSMLMTWSIAAFVTGLLLMIVYAITSKKSAS